MDASSRSVRTAMTVSALGLLAVGILLLFAPALVSVPFGAEARSHALHQLFGAALLGFSAMNWTARGLTLGGIYGRAVVAANQTHLTVGAILVVKAGLETANTHPVYWTVAACYAAGAAYFSYLMFFGSGIQKAS